MFEMLESRRVDDVIITPRNERNLAVRAAVAELGLPAVILDRNIKTQPNTPIVAVLMKRFILGEIRS